MHACTAAQLHGRAGVRLCGRATVRPCMRACVRACVRGRRPSRNVAILRTSGIPGRLLFDGRRE
eukprot:3848413-Alexandrium_andersonii.AAC.1